MAQHTRTWEEVVGLTQARSGAAFSSGTELTNIGFLLNSAARTIYDESRYWERYLVLEPRTAARGYIATTEDGFNVYGGGFSPSNGLYVRNGDANGKANYSIVKDDVANFNLRFSEPTISVSGSGETSVNLSNYVQTATVNGKPYFSDSGSFIQWISSGTPQWQIGAGGNSYYSSTDDVATPDLVTTWEIISGPSGPADSPVPTSVTSRTQWQIITLVYITSKGVVVTSEGDWVYEPGDVLYFNDSGDATPPEAGWVTDQGIDLPPIVDGLSEIGEAMGYWSGEKWAGGDPTSLTAYPDKNGIRVASNVTGTVYVAFKKSWTDTFGNGESGTLATVPTEWAEFMAYDAARSYRASQGGEDGFNPIALRDVNNALERALMKVSRSGAIAALTNQLKTQYSVDESV